MWPQLLRSHAAPNDRERFVIAPHHPHRLRRPAVSPSHAAEDRFRHALVWNVFRTLELVTPSFWLRRLHVRLTGEPSPVPPQIVSVRLWQPLPLPPIQRIDGERPDAVVDVIIETEHAVWSLIAPSTRADLADGGRAAAIVDAGTWFAGARPHYCGTLEWQPSLGSVLQARYGRSRDSARLQSASRGPALPGRAQWGTIRWPDLAGLLRDCSLASALPPIERALAGNALDWLTRAGVWPAAEDGLRPDVSS
jgi:hypothetical protein